MPHACVTLRARLLFPTCVCAQRLFERLALYDVRVNETLSVHQELRAAVKVLRKQRITLLAQLNRANRRTASLARDARHVSHVAHSAIDDGTKIEAKLERTQHEFEWETEQFKKSLAAMEQTAHQLDAKLVLGIEEADKAKEEYKQAHWAKVHGRMEHKKGMTTRHGLLSESHAYLEAKLTTICALVAVKYDRVLSVSAASTMPARARAWRRGRKRVRTLTQPAGAGCAWAEKQGSDNPRCICPYLSMSMPSRSALPHLPPFAASPSSSYFSHAELDNG
jgi:hypothetical protein